MERLNAITCLSWVPRGASKQDPDKVEVTEAELARIIAETKDDVDTLEEELCDDDYTRLETEALADDAGIKLKIEIGDNKQEVADEVMKENPDSDEEDIEKKYSFQNYEEEGEEELLLKLGRLTVHPSSKEDPYIQRKQEDSDSEKDDQKILLSDNLLAAGHIDGDAAILDVYVYNSDQRCLYVHHDILLPSLPLCMEWLNFDPGVEDLKPGNLLAVGCMSPVIEVWDLDMVDCLEPAFKLGRKARKKKKLSGIGHTDAVLSLAWNKELDHILASGSVDETVILWDIQEYKVSQKITCFTERIQALQWHPKESHGLLAGSCDKYLRMFDCRADDTYKSWKLDGDIEALSWDVTMSQPFCCFAATDTGMLYCIDARKDKPLWNIQAHSSPCTDISLSYKCPGCLVTISEDKLIRIWDVSPPKPELIFEKDPKLGILHTVSASPDDPFVFSFGGDNSERNFKVWDIRAAKLVRERFCPRVGLPVDEDGIDSDAPSEEESEDEVERMEAEDFKAHRSLKISQSTSSHSRLSNKPRPSQSSAQNKGKKKKLRKKKGGHLDNRH